MSQQRALQEPALPPRAFLRGALQQERKRLEREAQQRAQRRARMEGRKP